MSKKLMKKICMCARVERAIKLKVYTTIKNTTYGNCNVLIFLLMLLGVCLSVNQHLFKQLGTNYKNHEE
jgi:hypothetical protein